MARVITFSRSYPKYHPKSGEPTYFVEKLWESIGLPEKEYCFNLPGEYQSFLRSDSSKVWPKHHTIRAGHRWKKGDYFSPRAWSGKPYNSPMITIAPDTLITDVWDFRMEASLWIDECGYYLNNRRLNIKELTEVALNDGLDVRDLMCWFGGKGEANSKRKSFDGQIICWNKEVKY